MSVAENELLAVAQELGIDPFVLDSAVGYIARNIKGNDLLKSQFAINPELVIQAGLKA